METTIPIRENVRFYPVMERSAAKNAIFSFETLFALMVFSGVFKLSPPLSWAPVDPMIVLGLATAVVAVILFYYNGLDLWYEAFIICGLFGVFVVYALLSILWSPSSEYALSKGFRLASVTAAPLVLGTLIVARSRTRLRRLFGGIIVLATITALETLRGYVIADAGTTILPFGTTYLISGRLLGFAAIIAITALVFDHPTERRKYALVAITTLLGGALLITGARGPILATIGASTLLIYLAGWGGTLRDEIPAGRRSQVVVAVSGGILLVGLFGILIVVGQYIRGIRRLLMLTEGPDSSLSGRLDFYTWTLNALVSDPTLFGHGLGSWPVLFGAGDVRHYPHNIVLEIAFELGLVGLALFVALLGYACYTAYGEWRRTGQPECIAIILLIAFMVMNASVTGDLNDDRYLWVAVSLAAYQPLRTPRRVRRRIMSEVHWPLWR